MYDQKFVKYRRRIKAKAFLLAVSFHLLLIGGLLYYHQQDLPEESWIQQVKEWIPWQAEETTSAKVAPRT